MQPGLLIAIATALCVGFLFGYFVRAMVSWRRRRRFSRRFERANPDHVGGFRLKRLAGREEAADPTSLAAAADAPSLAELDVARRPDAANSDQGQVAQRKANGTMGKH